MTRGSPSRRGPRSAQPVFDPTGEEPPRALLERLLHKYEVLAGLREARSQGEPIPDKSVFRALADEHPGALYELDRLPIEDIEARREALRQALGGGGQTASWMLPLATYHALYRAALYIKARSRDKRILDAERALSLARLASEHASIGVDASFVTAVLAPDSGRIAPIIATETAARHGRETQELIRELFPTRRTFPVTRSDTNRKKNEPR